MTAQIELAKAVIKTTEPVAVTDDGKEYLLHSTGDVNVTLNQETKKLVGFNFTFGPLELTYTMGEFVLLEDDEASKITSEPLIQKINDYLEWRKGLLDDFDI